MQQDGSAVVAGIARRHSEQKYRFEILLLYSSWRLVRTATLAVDVKLYDGTRKLPPRVHKYKWSWVARDRHALTVQIFRK